MSIKFHPAASRELSDIAAYYEERCPGLGDEFLDELKALMLNLDENPRIGVQGEHRTRKALMGRFPFAVIYRQDGDELAVVALAHYRRRPGYWKNRK